MICLSLSPQSQAMDEDLELPVSYGFAFWPLKIVDVYGLPIESGRVSRILCACCSVSHEQIIEKPEGYGYIPQGGSTTSYLQPGGNGSVG